MARTLLAQPALGDVPTTAAAAPAFIRSLLFSIILLLSLGCSVVESGGRRSNRFECGPGVGLDQSISPSTKRRVTRLRSRTKVVGSAITAHALVAARSTSVRTGKLTGVHSRKRRTRAGTSATSMARTESSAGGFAASWRRPTNSARHGSHQVAKKWTMTTRPACVARSCARPSRSTRRSGGFAGPVHCSSLLPEAALPGRAATTPPTAAIVAQINRLRKIDKHTPPRAGRGPNVRIVGPGTREQRGCPSIGKYMQNLPRVVNWVVLTRLGRSVRHQSPTMRLMIVDRRRFLAFSEKLP